MFSRGYPPRLPRAYGLPRRFSGDVGSAGDLRRRGPFSCLL